MPWFRVTYESLFDEVEAEDAEEAKRAALPGLECYGATLEALAVEEIAEPRCE